MFRFIKNLLENQRIKKQIQVSPYADTLYSGEWLVKNHDRILDCLPETWTHHDNIDMVKFGFKMKLLDVPWTSLNELKDILTYFESLGMIHRTNEVQIVRNENNPIGSAARHILNSD